MAKQRQLPHKKRITSDGYRNIVSRVGRGSGNQHDYSSYNSNLTTLNRIELENLYRSSWLVGVAVDAIADDMTRKGITFTSNIKPERESEIDSVFDDLGVWDSLNDNIKWSRLYGGSIAVILIQGQDLDTELRIETVGKGSFKGLVVLDRWQLEQTITPITDICSDIGKPEYYKVVDGLVPLAGEKIHHSRVIRFDGVGLPYNQSITENGWGMSVVERLIDRLTVFDSATLGTGQLVYKAHLRTYSIEGLRKILALGGEAEDALMKHLDMIRKYQSNEGMTLMDSKDIFQTHSYSFAGLSDVMAQFAQQISGAIGIPLVRLFGQSPAGFSTGDADLSNYYDNVSSLQERRLKRSVKKILRIAYQSLYSEPLPPDFTFEFNSLWQMSAIDKSTVALNITNAIAIAYEAGVITKKSATTEFKQYSNETGLGSSITKEDIDNAEEEAPEPIINVPTGTNNQPIREHSSTGIEASRSNNISNI